MGDADFHVQATKSRFSFSFAVIYEGLELEMFPCLISLIGLQTDLLSFMTWPGWRDRYPGEYELEIGMT